MKPNYVFYILDGHLKRRWFLKTTDDHKNQRCSAGPMFMGANLVVI